MNENTQKLKGGMIDGKLVSGLREANWKGRKDSYFISQQEALARIWATHKHEEDKACLIEMQRLIRKFRPHLVTSKQVRLVDFGAEEPVVAPEPSTPTPGTFEPF